MNVAGTTNQYALQELYRVRARLRDEPVADGEAARRSRRRSGGRILDAAGAEETAVQLTLRTPGGVEG